MSARFAGSRSLDERRRRRLAAGAEEPGPSGETAAACGRSAAEGGRRLAPRVPLQKIISPRGWKVWLVVLAAYALGAGVLLAGAGVSRWERFLGPGIARLFAIGEARVTTFCGLLLLLASSQLALVIWWARSRSPRDFAGEYRIWSWASVVLFGAACAVATDAHHAWSETILWLWRTDFRHHATLAWLTPVALIAGTLFSSLLRDMAESRINATLLCLAAAAGVAAALCSFMRPEDPRMLELVQQGTVLFAEVSLFSALLLHARHVAYWSADPPPRRPSRLWALIGRVRLPRIRLRTASATIEGESAETAEEGERPAKASRARRAATQEKKGAAKRAATAAAKDEASEATPCEDVAGEVFEAAPVIPAVPPAPNREEPQMFERRAPEVELARGAEPSKPSGSEPQYRIDAPDKSMLKGLSKRERRKLQQEWREQQRAAKRG
jgi:hypothetical protein